MLYLLFGLSSWSKKSGCFRHFCGKNGENWGGELENGEKICENEKLSLPLPLK